MVQSNYILVDLTEDEFEARRGRTFLTVNTENPKSSAPSKYPTHRTAKGEEFHTTVHFDTYEEYLKYNKS